MKRIIVSVTNDLAGDNRVHKVCLTLAEMGFRVMLTGRRYGNSPSLRERPYATRRLRMVCRKGPLFYAEFNIRLLLYLLCHRADLLLSNDLDTLPANFMAGWFKRIPVIYDSHELFTEVPELIGRPRVRKIWEWLERRLLPHVVAAYTVSPGIAAYYDDKYHVKFGIVRNLPLPLKQEEKMTGDRSTDERKTIIYQGALNMGRGLEQAIRAMQYLNEADLLVVGSGDLDESLRNLVKKLGLTNVEFTGRIPLEEVIQLTRKASLGISVEEDLGLNYHFALPNKLFDYIQAGIPVVVSDLPEMSLIVRNYNIGMTTASLEPHFLAEVFRQALTNEGRRKQWAANLQIAAAELNWDQEKPVLQAIFRPFR